MCGEQVRELHGDFESANDDIRRTTPTKEAIDGGCPPLQNGGMGNGVTLPKIGGRPYNFLDHYYGG